MIPLTKERTTCPETGRTLTDAEGRCHCGCIVILDSSWANACEACGREYLRDGTELAPREQWGEETGETMADMEGPVGMDY